jgi:hypothetical protein
LQGGIVRNILCIDRGAGVLFLVSFINHSNSELYLRVPPRDGGGRRRPRPCASSTFLSTWPTDCWKRPCTPCSSPTSTVSPSISRACCVYLMTLWLQISHRAVSMTSRRKLGLHHEEHLDDLK